EDMTMFGQLRPKPDARMLRRVIAALGVPACRCVLVEDTLVHQKAACRIGMRAVWMRRYVGAAPPGMGGGSVRDAARSRPGLRRCPKPPYVYARIGALRKLEQL